jgi:hypothetical protein
MGLLGDFREKDLCMFGTVVREAAVALTPHQDASKAS